MSAGEIVSVVFISILLCGGMFTISINTFLRLKKQKSKITWKQIVFLYVIGGPFMWYCTLMYWGLYPVCFISYWTWVISGIIFENILLKLGEK